MSDSLEDSKKPPSMEHVIVVNLRRLMGDHGISASALAASTGLSRSHIYGILAGERIATTKWIGRLADALGVEWTTMLHWSPHTEKSQKKRWKATAR